MEVDVSGIVRVACPGADLGELFRVTFVSVALFLGDDPLIAIVVDVEVILFASLFVCVWYKCEFFFFIIVFITIGCSMAAVEGVENTVERTGLLRCSRW